MQTVEEKPSDCWQTALFLFSVNSAVVMLLKSRQISVIFSTLRAAARLSAAGTECDWLLRYLTKGVPLLKNEKIENFFCSQSFIITGRTTSKRKQKKK